MFFVWSLGLVLASTQVEVPLPPSGRAAVLGEQLYQQAIDVDRPLDEILQKLRTPLYRRGLRLRALAFADLQLRGLRRFCGPQQGHARHGIEPRFAYLPDRVFTETELAATRRRLSVLQGDVPGAWQKHAARYHREIRALKANCPTLPRAVRAAQADFRRGIDKAVFFDLGLRRELRRLLDDYVEALDVESAFPRIQYAANGLSYRLGLQGLSDFNGRELLRRFERRYAQFVAHSDDHTRLLDQALEVTQADARAALWLIAFAFRNFPHLYELYLVDLDGAAALEVLFLRIKAHRLRVLGNEPKMLLHYPPETYVAGDRRASPYHFWSGGYVASELLQRGHRPVLSALSGGAFQVAYELLAAARFALSAGADPGESVIGRLRRFIDRSATFEDSAAGVLGAFEALQATRRFRFFAVGGAFVTLRREAWRLLDTVKWLRPVLAMPSPEPPSAQDDRSGHATRTAPAGEPGEPAAVAR